MTSLIDLNGWWDWRTAAGQSMKRMVPSCYPCVGKAFYSRAFELGDFSGKLVFLCFEGVSYTAALRVNGAEAGFMLPYVPYDFDVTTLCRPGENIVELDVEDVTARYGPTNGWEDYGGIPRGCRAEIRDRAGIADVRWIAELKNDYAAADARVNVELYGGGDFHVTGELRFHGETAARASAQGTGRCVLDFSLERVFHWDTDNPNLYTLRIQAESAGIADEREIEVGFREFAARGSRFVLNGKPIFLKGVARHESWGGQGFCLTKEQTERDLDLIKKTGANFVRLVHYPHSRHTVEYASKIGLLVSEEPGLWWSDLSDPYIIDSALEIMRRAVIRDRNQPSVAAWLFFNECEMTYAAEYLRRGAALCRGLDPTRPLSGANCMDNEKAKQVFDDAGMDFYTQHPYCYEAEGLLKAADILRGKPLVLTEWGGWLIHENPNLIRLFKKVFAKLIHAPEGEPSVSGMCWWQWQDITQMSRGLPGCVENGLLNDGLVDAFRRRKPMYTRMAEFFDIADHEPEPLFDVIETPLRIETRFTPLDISHLTGQDNDAAWARALEKESRKALKATPYPPAGLLGVIVRRELTSLGGAPCHIPARRPVLLSRERGPVSAPVHARASRLYVFGATSFFDGYPIRGEAGETCAALTLYYADGTAARTPLRHGCEVSSASLIARCSKVDARAALAPRIARFVMDADWEDYAVNLLAVEADPGRTLERVEIECLDDEFDLMVCGISVSETEEA